MEEPIISGVACDLSEGKLTVTGVPRPARPGGGDLRGARDHGANLDMIVQNVSTEGLTDITVTPPAADADRATAALGEVRDRIGHSGIRFDPEVAKVSLVVPARRSPGVSATFFRALAEAGINVELISTSEIRISVVCRAADAPGRSPRCTPPSASTPTTTPPSTPALEGDHRERNPQAHPGSRRRHRRRRLGHARPAEHPRGRLGRHPPGGPRRARRQEVAGPGRGGRGARPGAGGLRRCRRGHVRRPRRGQRRVGADRSGRGAVAVDNSGRSGWTTTCRWWCRGQPGDGRRPPPRHHQQPQLRRCR